MYELNELAAHIRILGDTFVIFNAESNSFFPRVLACHFERLNGPMDALLHGRPGRKLAREDAQMRGSQRLGDIDPLLDLLQNLRAPARISLHRAGSRGCTGKTYTVLVSQMSQGSQIGWFGRFEPVSRHVHGINAEIDGLSDDVFHGHLAGFQEFAVRIGAAARKEPGLCFRSRFRAWHGIPCTSCAGKFRTHDDGRSSSSQKFSAMSSPWCGHASSS